jgi:hypothetical protein
MSFLDTLPQNEKELIISLPYRVGIWISHSDDTGGEVASVEEIAALNAIIEGFTRDVFGSEVVQYIMMETMASKDKWDGWAQNYKNIAADCQRAIDILNAAVDEKEVNAFRQRLYEIAEAVALAFREYDQLDFLTKMRVYLNYYREKMAAAKRKHIFKTMDQYLNISLKERKALKNLAHTLALRNA